MHAVAFAMNTDMNGAGLGAQHEAAQHVLAGPQAAAAVGEDRLERDGEGRVCGVQATIGGRVTRIGARCGVILACGEVARFNDAAPPHSFPEDLAIALEIDRFDFAVQVRAEDGFLVARKRTVQ